MSITAAELIFFSSANMPVSDVGTSGGAIDTASRPSLTQFSATANAFLESDGADVRTVTITYRDPAGVLQTVTPTLNGTTPVDSGVSMERILRAVASATSGTRTILIKQGSGGTTRVTIPVNETTATAMFIASASSPGGTVVRYEKIFGKNTNSTLTLTGASVQLTTDSASRITIGCEAAIDGTQSVAARTTAPSPSVTFVDDSVDQGVPGGVIPAGSRIGIWIKQSLPANDPAAKATFTVQLAGSTT